MSYEREVIPTIEEYYAKYPQYIDPADIAEYPSLDPSVPIGQLLTRTRIEIIA